MRHSSRIWLVIVAMIVGAGAFSGGGLAQAKGKKVVGAGPSTKKEVNACGCYKDTAGQCFCGRKGKCSCPGDCEPKGCEEKRAKEMQKEIAAETKKAAEADKKQRASSKEKATKASSKKPSGVGQ
jgi:hypothetical protein